MPDAHVFTEVRPQINPWWRDHTPSLNDRLEAKLDRIIELLEQADPKGLIQKPTPREIDLFGGKAEELK